MLDADKRGGARILAQESLLIRVYLRPSASNILFS